MADAEVSETTYALALIREYLVSRGCTQTVKMLDAMKLKGVKQVSDLYSLPAPSSKLLPPAGSESSDSTFFRMIDALANRSSSRRRGDKKSSRSSKHKAKDADDDETSWSRKENSTLVKAAKKFPGSLPKKERWTEIAKVVGRPSKDCYKQYKLLKEKKGKKDAKSSKAPEDKKDTEAPVAKKTPEDKKDAEAPVAKKASAAKKDVKPKSNWMSQSAADDGHEASGRSWGKSNEFEEVIEESASSEEEALRKKAARKKKHKSKKKHKKHSSKGPKPVSTGWGNIVTPSGAASSAAAVEELETEDLEDMETDSWFQPASSARVSRDAPAKHSSRSAASSSSSPSISFVKGGTSLPLKTCQRLKTVFFGTGVASAFGAGNSRDRFNDAWRKQGFYFSEDVPYGLVQAEGGPCGALAVVQAYTMKHLLKAHGPQTVAGGAIPHDKRWKAVVEGLADILQNCARSGNCVVALPGPPSTSVCLASSSKYRPDGLTEVLHTWSFRTRAQLVEFLTADRISALLQEPHGCGVAAFCYSCALSHGLDKLERTMGLSGSGGGFQEPLVGGYDYASQAFVNLTLSGIATSQVFNDFKEIGGVRVRGVPRQSEIGFLTRMEKHGHMKVGSYYKNPQLPIWVIQSESHYSCIFSLDTRALADTSGSFDVFWYDELACQDEQIRLTLTTGSAGQAKIDDDIDDEVSPIDETVRTKWGMRAHVDWNGVEKIL